MMILQVILEGIGLGVLLILVCAIGICKGAVGMPGMDGNMWTLAQQTLSKLKRMTDSD